MLPLLTIRCEADFLSIDKMVGNGWGTGKFCPNTLIAFIRKAVRELKIILGRKLL